MEFILWIAGIYVVVLIGAMLLNRYFIYHPSPERLTPVEAGLSGVTEIGLKAHDGTQLFAWYSPARDDKPTLLYFTGNAGSAMHRAEKIERVQADGYGILILNYRGTGGSGGSPSEEAFVSDAIQLYDWLEAQGVSAENIIAYGESLGTGVAAQLALARPVSALILEAPFTSVPDVGQSTYFFLPLRLILADQFRTVDLIGDVNVPVLVVHGEQDRVIPVSHAKRIYAAANEPKKLVLLEEGGHSDLFSHGAWDKVRHFIARLRRPELEELSAG